MTLNELRDEVHGTAVDKGWWEEQGRDGVYVQRSIGDLIALVHSELSEALEEYRNGHLPNETYWQHPDGMACENPRCAVEGLKPEGVPTELADVLIRVLDMAGWYGIDIEEAVHRKMKYNLTRPVRHGGKVL